MNSNRLIIEYHPMTRIENKTQSMRCNSFRRAREIVRKRFVKSISLMGISNIIKASFYNQYGVMNNAL